jgi:hypothetical protein
MSAFTVDPNKDLQEQLRPSLHVKMSNLMRPNLKGWTETSSPTTMIMTTREEDRRKDRFIPTSPEEFRNKHKDRNKRRGRRRRRRESIAINLSSPLSHSTTFRSLSNLETTPYSAFLSTKSSRSASPVFDRLSDPKQYTGIYRRRNEIQVNDDGTIVKDTNINHFTETTLVNKFNVYNNHNGSTNQKTDQKVNDIKDIMRPNLRISTDENSSTKMAFTAREVRRRSIYSLRYQQQLDRQQKQRKQEQRTLANKSRKKTMQKQNDRSVFDRLSDSSSFTGSHKHRFDPVTGKGKGAIGRSLPAKGPGQIPKSQRIHVLLRPEKYMPKKKVRDGCFVSKKLKNYNQNKYDAMTIVKRKQEKEHHDHINCWLEETINDAKRRSAVGLSYALENGRPLSIEMFSQGGLSL